MILANDFLEYLLNTERDLAARVRDRYDMYLKSLPVPQLADGKIVISPCRHRRHRAGNSAAGYSLPRHPEWHDEVNHYDGRVHQGLATTAPRSGA